MTLVLPAAAFCGNHPQQAAKPVFTSAATRNSNSTTMPCVFDGEPLDFESALMTDWPTLKDITDYDNSIEDEADKNSATGSSERDSMKRKSSCDDGTESVEAKRPRNDDPEPSTSYNSGVTSQPASSSSSSSSSSSDCSSPEKDLADHEDMDDELFFPRRSRVSHLWNSRQRWKDERKKVLKMSIKKLTEIEDPELLLLRSVLINNTIKRLHQDIRNERQAKMRHRMQRHDYFCSSTSEITDRLPEPPTSSRTNGYDDTLPSTSYHNQQDYNNTASKPQKEVTPPSLYDDSSCDEIFGINEDFLRVTIPDRRVSSPIPSTTVQEDEESSSPSRSCQNDDSPMNCDGGGSGDLRTTNCCSSPSASPASFSRPRTERASSPSYPSPLPSPRRQVPSPSNQCATQYRTQQDCMTSPGSGDSSFPPRVPILDSVVYHSLLASLES